MTLYQCPRNALAILDIAKVADVLVFVIGADADAAAGSAGVIPMDTMTQHIATIVRAQGMPAPLGVVQGLHRFDAKKIVSARALATNRLQSLIADDLKVMSLDTADEADQLRRFVANIKLR